MTDIEKLVKSINKSIDDMSKEAKKEKKEIKLPSNSQIMLSAGSDDIGIETVFSGKLDSVVSSLFDKILMGDFDLGSVPEKVEELLSKVEKTAFKGELSQRLVNNITNSINSDKFKTTQSKIKKCLLIIRNLQKEYRSEKDKEKRKKLKQATNAILEVLKLTGRIYKVRKKLQVGLNVAINEAEALKIDKEIGFMDDENRWTSICVINGENYKHRVEVLIFKGNQIFLAPNPKADEEGYKYIIPGGRVERDKSNEMQVADEAKEEAGLLISNISNTNIYYITEKKEIPKWVIEKVPVDKQWRKTYTQLYTADYSGEYKGKVADVDVNEQIQKGEFFDIDDVICDLRPEWQKAILKKIVKRILFTI
jgi:8-oxo-dGTP pyrophosphatase MutT (NUDIX family)